MHGCMPVIMHGLAAMYIDLPGAPICIVTAWFGHYSDRSCSINRSPTGGIHLSYIYQAGRCSLSLQFEFLRQSL